MHLLLIKTLQRQDSLRDNLHVPGVQFPSQMKEYLKMISRLRVQFPSSFSFLPKLGIEFTTL